MKYEHRQLLRNAGLEPTAIETKKDIKETIDRFMFEKSTTEISQFFIDLFDTIDSKSSEKIVKEIRRSLKD